MGGPQADSNVSAIAVDSIGNVYTTGRFIGTADFDPGPGVFNLTTSAGSQDFFVSKLDSAGNFVWARRIGGPGFDQSFDVAVDGSGNVYTTGEFVGSVDFNPGAGVFNLLSPGDWDIFVSKLDSAGNFVWAREMGGPGDEVGLAVAVDGSGNVYTTGYINSFTNFDPVAGPFNLTSAGGRDIFVSKLDSSGNFVWARQMGGTGDDRGLDVAVDSSGNVYTTGSFDETVDFDPGPGVFNLTGSGGFVSKLDNAGSLIWARQTDGTGESMGLDGSGNVYTTGGFSGIADLDPSASVFNLTSAGSSDVFVSKLDSAGNFGWAQQMGGTGLDEGTGMALDGSGNVYTTGRFTGTSDFDPSASVFNLTSAGGRDLFLAKYTGETSGGLPPVISEGGIVLATLLPTVNTVSPLSIISVFGENFTTEMIANPNLDSEGKLATTLGGTCLMMNGQALPIFAIFPTQINAQVSADKTLGPASFTVVTNCATTAPISSSPLTIEIGRAAAPTPQALTSGVEMATVEEATPGFFLFPPRTVDAFIAARFNAIPNQLPVPVAPANSFPNDRFGPSRPAEPGDIILLYGTGWGETTAGLAAGELASGAAELLPEANPMVTFGGIPMSSEDVLYVGVTPTTAGLYQLAIRVPANALPGNNEVILTVYGKSTPVGPVIPVVVP